MKRFHAGMAAVALLATSAVALPAVVYAACSDQSCTRWCRDAYWWEFGPYIAGRQICEPF